MGNSVFPKGMTPTATRDKRSLTVIGENGGFDGKAETQWERKREREQQDPHRSHLPRRLPWRGIPSWPP
ncbi:MAG: hypothetical protein WC483_06355 [Candidatus Paceibacterota bacterium]